MYSISFKSLCLRSAVANGLQVLNGYPAKQFARFKQLPGAQMLPSETSEAF